MIQAIESGFAGPGAGAPARPGGELGKDEFLKLLVTQLRYQDPLNPMDAQQMAAQLAQFSSVEQLVDIDAKLGVMAQGANTNAALGVLGRTVVAAGDHVVVPEDGAASVTVVLGGSGKATLRLYDAAGNEVASRDAGSLAAGRQIIELGSAAASLPAGVYRYTLEVTGADGESVPVQSYTTARIDGIRYGAAGPVLVAGPLEIPLGAVEEVSTNL